MQQFNSERNCITKFLKNARFVCLSLFALFLSVQAVAQNFIVNNGGDTHAANAAASPLDGSGNITLRSAVEAANAQAGSHIITFSGAVTTINLSLGQISVGSATSLNIAINGLGMNILTVNQTTAARIFTTTTQPNFNFTMQDMTLNYAGPSNTPPALPGSFSGGGGALLAGGTGAVTTVSNCKLTNWRNQSGNGGAIAVTFSSVSHNFTMTGCVFDNNMCGGAGGAVAYSGLGTVSISNCTFTNNSCGPVGANIGGSGGALNLTGQAPGGTYSVTECTFVNNSCANATSPGGAVMHVNGQLALNYNRFVGNTAAAGGSAVYQSGGDASYVINATNNWWGHNTAPTATEVSNGPSPVTPPNVTTWLQLKLSASPGTLCATTSPTTSLVTASFLSNSAGTAIPVANLDALIGLPISYSAVLGTLSGAQTTIQASGTATVTFTSNGTAGAASVNGVVDNVPANDPTAKASITVNILPNISSQPSNATVCAGGTTTFSVTAGGTPAPTYQWRIGTTNLSNGATGNGSTISGATTNSLTITNTALADAAANYNVVVTNSCGTVTSNNVSLTVKALPVVTAPTVTQPTCTTPTGTIVVNATGASGTLEYSINNGTSYQASATFSGLAPGSSNNIMVRYTAAPNCPVAYASNPVVIAAVPLPPTVNNPATTTGTVGVAFSQTFTTTGGLAPIAFATTSTLPTGLTLSATGTLSGTPTQSGTFPIVVKATDANGCVGTGATYNLVISCQTITVTNPGVTTGTIGTAFSQTFTQTGGNGTTTFSTTSTLPAGLTLSSAGVLSGTPTQSGTFPIVVKATDANGCSGNGATYNLVISCQTITVTNPVNTTGQLAVPFSETFTQTGGIGTTTFSTTSTLPTGLTLSSAGVLSGTPTQSGTFPIVVKATDANGCIGTGATYTLVINTCPTITVTNPATTTGTVGTAFSQSFSAAGGLAPYTYSTVSTLPTGLTLSAAGVLSGTPTQSGTFPIVVKATDANLCTGNSPTYTLVIGCPAVSVNTVSNQVVCNGASTTAVSFTGSPAGTVFNWTNNAPSIGLAASGTGDIASFTATNATGAPLVATITVTPVYGVNCSGTPTTFTITVNPTATVTAVANQAVCNGANTTAVTFSSPTTGGTIVYNWTNNTTSIGLAASGSGNIASFAATNATAAAVTATITVTPSYTNGAVTCTGTPTTFTITVNPTPTVNAVTSQTVCNGASTAAVTFSGATAGTVYNWTNNNTSIGLAAGGSGNIASFTATNATGAPVTATITVTPSYTNGGTTCTGTPTSFTITVNPTATVNTVANQVVCNGATTAAVSFSSPATGGTIVYNWTNNTPSIGLAASGSGDIASFTATNATGAPVTATITVTAAYTNGAVTCNGTPRTFTITVNPTATVNTVANQTLCNTQSTTAITFSSPTTGGTIVYNWTNNTPSIGLAASGSGNIASFVAINTGSTPVVATITVTPSYTNGGTTCTGTPTTFTITVTPPPATTCPGNINVNATAGVCSAVVSYAASGSGTISYTFSGATTGTGSGTGSGSSFNVGVTTVTVTSTSTCGNSSCSFTVTVNDIEPPVITCPAQIVVCGSQVVNYPLPTVTDNCTVGNPLNLTQSASTSIAASNSVSCNNGVGHTANGYWRVYDLAALGVTGPYTVKKVIFGVESANTASGSQPVSIKVYTLSGAFTIANLTQVASEDITIANQAQTLVTVNLTTPPTVAANAKLVLEVFTPDGRPTGSLFYMGSNTAAQTAPNYISAPDCGVIDPVDVSSVGYPNMHSVINAEGIVGAPIVPVQTAGLPSGSTFPVGTTVNTYTATDAAGNTSSCSFNVIVNPVPTVNAVGNQELCNGATTTAVTFTGAVAGTVYNWTNNTPSIGLAASGTGNIAAFVASNLTNAPVVATITVTPAYTNNGLTCTGAPITFTITVDPKAQVNPVGNQVVCNGAPTTAVTFTGTTANTVYNWTNNTPSIGLAASGTGNIASFTATNATGAPVVATITVTPTFTGGTGSCPGTPITFTITVNPTATVNAVANQVICNGGNTTAVTFSSPTTGGTIVYNWTNNTPSIGLAASGSGNIASFVGTNATGAPVTATITVTPSYTNGAVTCVGTPITFTITVNPTPSVNAVANQVVCNGANTTAVNFSGSAPGTIYNWTNNTTSIGLAASGTGNIGSFVATNATTAPVTATITVTPSYTNGGTTCTGTPTTFTITVNPTATVNTVASQVICNGANTTAVNFSSPTTGGTIVYNWTNNTTSIGLAASGSGNIASFVATNATTAPVTATITVTPSYTNGAVTCVGTPITFTITVNPTATVNAVANQVVCNGANTTAVNFSSPTTGGTIVYNWTNNTTSIGLAASGTGNIASFVATNATTAPVTATITVTPSYTNGSVTCVGTPRTFTITVNPTATINAVSNQVICNGANTTAVSFSSPTTGGTIVYNWTNNTTSIGLAASGTGNIASFVATNATTAPVTATITVTPSYTNGAVTCVGTPITFTITVNPTATVNAVSNQVVCNGANTTAVTFSSPTTGGTIVYNWTNNTPSIGLAASGSGDIASFVATNATTAPVTATITVTPSYTNGSVTCVGTPRTFTITVNPTATINAVANQAVCNNANTTAITFSSPTTGGTIVYNWTNNTTSIGLAASGTGNIASFVATNSGTAPVTATITVTPSYTNGAVTCVGTPITFTITVNPTATINAVSNQVVCNGANTTAVTFSSPTTGGTIVYNWTNNTTSIGLAASGSGNIASFVGTNVTNAPVTATITVTPSYTNAGVTCVGTPITFTITVNPTATINAVANQVVCNNSNTAAVNFSSPTTGGTIVYNWTNNTTSIGLAASGTGNIASFVGTNVTTAPVTATITVTPSYTNGGVTCVGTPITFTITVNPTATINAVANQVVCNNANTTAINFSSPTTGGTIVYNWINSTPSIGLAATGSGNIASFVATNATLAPVIATIVATPSYTNGGVTCVGTPITFTITVNPTAPVNTVANQVVCNNANTTAITFSSPATGGTIVYNWTNNTPSIGLAASGSGSIASFTATNSGTAPVTATITVTPTYSNGGANCVGTPTTFTITVNPTATVTAVANQTVCNGGNTTAVTFSSPTTGGTIVYNWTNNTPAIGLAASGTGNIPSFVGTNTTSGLLTGTITVTPVYSNGGATCTGTPTTFTITVNPVATVNTVANQVVCNNGNTAAVNFSSPTTGGTIVYNWTNNTTSIGLAASGTGNIPSFVGTNATNGPVTATITVTPTYSNGGANCVGTPTTFTITVNPVPVVNTIANQVLCNKSITAAVVFSSPNTGGTVTYSWTNNNPLIGLAASGTGNIPSFIANNLGILPLVATITVTPSYTNGGVTCTGTPKTFTIIVNPTPLITVLNAPSRICLTDTAVVLRATPAGGVWAGTALVPGALVNGVFDPAKSGQGAFTLTYTYIDPAFSCPGVAYANVFVVDCVERHNRFKEALKVYPNPNNGKFFVKLLSDSYKTINLRLVDSRGREVGRFTFNNLFYGSILPFDVRSLASGVYMLEAYSDNEKASFQVVIQH